jgi:hypothetical protein
MVEPSALPDAAERSPRPAKVAVLLFLLCLGCYLANGRTVSFGDGGDTIPNRLIPFSILAYGTLTLDPFRDEFAARGGYRWYIQEREGHLVSLYPIGTSVVALLVYLPLYLGLVAIDMGDPASLFAASQIAEKIAASTIAAATVGIFYLLLRRRTDPVTAFWGAAAFGLGSSMWATVSQALWQHGPVALMLTGALWLLTWPKRPAWTLAGAGFLLSMAVLSRPMAVILWSAGLACALAGGGTLRDRLSRTLLFLGASLPIIAFNLAYNLSCYQTLVGGYGLMSGGLVPSQALQGMAGLLASPNRGLLIFTPAALLGMVGLARAVWPVGCPLLIPFGVAAAAHLVFMGSYAEWAGGWSFGPRYLVEILPILGLAGAEMWQRLKPAGKNLMRAALFWSVLVQINGVVCYPASYWNVRMAEGIEEASWDWAHFSLWEDFRAWRELRAASRF